MFTFSSILSLVGKVTLLLTVTAILDAVMRRASAAARHRLWSATLVTIILLPALEGLMPRWQIAILPNQWNWMESRDA